ncbi:MAG: hypothetical protein K9N62_03835 [Verrucomicrobia bacterium]|nr:hypothetical protein [Verrucomicrobiota bacterium]
MDSNLPNSKQDELFDEGCFPLGHELLTIEKRAAEPGKFTGERIARDRARYDAIIRALGEGMGIRHIARAFRISTHTVQAIRDREGLAIATQKKEVASLMGRFIRTGVERLCDELDTIPIGQLSVSIGIISDKKALLEGDPTEIVEHRSGEPATPDAVRDWFENMKRAKAVEAEDQALPPPSDSQSGGLGDEPQQNDIKKDSV